MENVDRKYWSREIKFVLLSLERFIQRVTGHISAVNTPRSRWVNITSEKKCVHPLPSL